MGDNSRRSDTATSSSSTFFAASAAIVALVITAAGAINYNATSSPHSSIFSYIGKSATNTINKRMRKRREKKMLTVDYWFNRAQDEDGRIINPELTRKMIIEGGIEGSLRQDVWPFLLNMREANDSAVEVQQQKEERRKKYVALRKRCRELELMMKSGKVWKDSLPPRDLGVFTEAAAVIRGDAPRTHFVYGEFAATYEAMSKSESEDNLNFKKNNNNNNNNKSDDDDDREVTASMKKISKWELAQIKRCRKILEAFTLYDHNVGYCQGMNDIAAGFLRDCVDESEAFWCFTNFVSGSFRSHFIISGHAHSIQNSDGGISERLLALSTIISLCDRPLFKHMQLIQSENCMHLFRAVVVLMSRELEVRDTIYLWDVLMATRDFLPTVQARAMAAAAAVQEERNNSQFDGDVDIYDDVLTVGGGRLFLHVVCAAFLELRSSVFACKNYDDLLQLSTKLPHMKLDVSRLIAKAKILLTKTKVAGEAKITQNVVAAQINF